MNTTNETLCDIISKANALTMEDYEKIMRIMKDSEERAEKAKKKAREAEAAKKLQTEKEKLGAAIFDQLVDFLSTFYEDVYKDLRGAEIRKSPEAIAFFTKCLDATMKELQASTTGKKVTSKPITFDPFESMKDIFLPL